MARKILYFLMMTFIVIIVTFLTMFTESSKGMSAFINEAIEENKYDRFLAYNDYYIDTPLASLETDDYVVKVHNAFDSGRQGITIIIVDKTSGEGDDSQVKVTCDEVFTYEDVFFEYDKGHVAVLSLYESGEGEYELDDSCEDGVIDRFEITSNSGELILDVTDSLMFINDGDFTSSGIEGYTQEDLMDIQYPRGLIVPMILPLVILLVTTLGIVFLYKKVFKKTKK